MVLALLPRLQTCNLHKNVILVRWLLLVVTNWPIIGFLFLGRRHDLPVSWDSSPRLLFLYDFWSHRLSLLNLINVSVITPIEHPLAHINNVRNSLKILRYLLLLLSQSWNFLFLWNIPSVS